MQAQPTPGLRRPAIERALTYIEQHLSDPLPLDVLASAAGLSVWRFSTVFRRCVGAPPHRYICERRVRRAQTMLGRGMPAALAATEAGFYDQSHLARHFKSVCGMTPGAYLAHLRAA